MGFDYDWGRETGGKVKISTFNNRRDVKGSVDVVELIKKVAKLNKEISNLDYNENPEKYDEIEKELEILEEFVDDAKFVKDIEEEDDDDD